MKISIIGAGYVGLVTGLVFAEKGHEVVCVDYLADKVKKINEGKCPVHESGLDDLLKKNIGKRFSASTDLRKAVLESEISFICVGTPNKNGNVDLSFLESAARDVGAALKDKKEYHAVVVKSTVLPGTTEEVILPKLIESSGKKVGEFGIAMNPEFLAEGSAVKDALEPGRIVIGSLDVKTRSLLEKLYYGFNAPKVHTNIKTAEMIKYASNSLLANLISFSNEIANISELKGGIDVKEVMEAVHLDKRLTPRINGEIIKPGILSFLMAGCGFGGSCFPKDVEALNRMALAYTVLGKSKSAKSTYQKVLEIDPLNSIALKNIKKIKVDSSDNSGDGIIIQVNNIFLEETGKTKVVDLINLAQAEILLTLRTGQYVDLSTKRLKIFISQGKKYIGVLPDDIGKRLIKFIKGGNKYEAYVKSASHQNVTIFIRELKRAAKYKDQPSFLQLVEKKLSLRKSGKTKNKDYDDESDASGE